MLGMLEAVQGSLKEELRLDIISNNLANATTIGFKKDRISFQNMLLEASSESEPTPTTEATAEDTLLCRITSDFSQGEVRSTGNELDLCICGKGFFKINTPEGVRYTRKGSFTLDRDGYLTTQNGYQVLGRGGPINVWGKQVEVDGTGRVRVEGSEVGQLDVVDLSNPEKLEKAGSLLFSPTPENQEIPLPSDTSIRQGYLEDSNVNTVEEMVHMIHAMRGFESYQKAIQVLNKLDDTASNEVGILR